MPILVILGLLGVIAWYAWLFIGTFLEQGWPWQQRKAHEENLKLIEYHLRWEREKFKRGD